MNLVSTVTCVGSERHSSQVLLKWESRGGTKTVVGACCSDGRGDEPMTDGERSRVRGCGWDL